MGAGAERFCLCSTYHTQRVTLAARLSTRLPPSLNFFVIFFTSFFIGDHVGS